MSQSRANSPISLVRGFFTVGFWTLASRVFGFIRDIVFAALLGAGPVAEAFLIAFSLPNMFRRIFAEGAFNTAFVPMYAKKLSADDNAERFADDAMSALAGFLICFTLAAQVAMPLLVFAMASGFAGDERFDIAVFFGRIAFPYVLFISLAALMSGVLNAAGRFAAAAAAPVLLNLAFIAALTLAAVNGLDAGFTLACAVPAAGIAQLALVWIAAERAGYRVRIRTPKITPELRRLAVIAAPAALAGGVVQINLVIGRQVASQFEGAVAWLSYADRLYQLPLGVVGIAIGVVLLPDLSHKLSAGNDAGARDSYNRAAEAALALGVPASVALAVVPLPVVSILFERGQFTASDSAATAAALAIYAAGLPAFVLQKVVQPLFFARHDTRTPFLCALAAMVINAVIAVGLAGSLGYLAAAIGVTVAGWAMLVLLWIRARLTGASAGFDAQFRRALPKILLAAVIMGTTLWIAVEFTQQFVGASAVRYLWLACLVVGGALFYGGMLLVLGAFRWDQIRSVLKRG